VSDLSGLSMVPGQVVVADTPLDLGDEPDVVLIVSNTADRPVQVGSHFHFAEANAALEFDRGAAWGRRLAIAAGTSVRFEPGIEREVALTPLRGNRRVPGLRGVAGGALDPSPAAE
jgi:urease subunit beta